MITITLLDHVNCHFDGLNSVETKTIIDKTGIREKDSFMSPAFQLGEWDGKTSQFSEDGFCFNYMIEDVVNILINVYDYEDHEFELVDERPHLLPDHIPDISADFLIEETGLMLRDKQVIAINKAKDERKGMLDLATNAGKTFICLALSKILDPYIKTVIVVPSENLAKQTYKDYQNSKLNCLLLHKNIKPDKREEAIHSHRHIIVTTKLFQNTYQYFNDDTYGFFIDEAHKFGEVLAGILRFDMGNSPVRLGLTGSVPSDKFKRHMTFCHLGGDILMRVTQKELIDAEHASTIDIKMHITEHKEIEEIFAELIRKGHFDWSLEQDYLLNNQERIERIGDFIKLLEPKNTLILCHPQLGSKLSEYLGIPLIHDKTKPEQRLEWLDGFNTKEDHNQLASFDTTGTGLSYNRIFRLINIDIGKDETKILQGIGRVMRLDGELDHADIIDISANTMYSKKHRKERIKIYKREEHPFTIVLKKIII